MVPASKMREITARVVAVTVLKKCLFIFVSTSRDGSSRLYFLYDTFFANGPSDESSTQCIGLVSIESRREKTLGMIGEGVTDIEEAFVDTGTVPGKFF
jgi:hypothetical protein